MGVFKKLFSKDSSTGLPAFDPFMRDEPIRAAAIALASGNWQAAEQALNVHPDPAHGGALLSSDLSNIPLTAFEKWANESPSVRSLSMLGQAQIRAAWAIRGGSYANDVNDSAWHGFFGGLRLAEKTLRTAAERDPSSADPWVGLITTARGLQLTADEGRHRFEQAHAREPFRPGACNVMLQNLCEKWSGSHEEMFAFARWVEAHAPADSSARTAIHVAHFEYVAAKRDEGMMPSAYFRLPEVSAELVTSAERFLASTTGSDRARHLSVLNWFVFTLHPIDYRSATAVTEAIRRIAGRPTASPWFLFDDDIALRYQKMSAAMLAQARQF